jgi:superfamily II DNA or RNA helicase
MTMPVAAVKRTSPAYRKAVSAFQDLQSTEHGPARTAAESRFQEAAAQLVLAGQPVPSPLRPSTKHSTRRRREEPGDGSVDHDPPSAFFPGIDDERFVQKLMARPELAALAKDASSTANNNGAEAEDQEQEEDPCSATSFSLSKPQLLVRSLVNPASPLNSMFVFAGVGMGKTCMAIQIAESFREEAAFSKKVLVISKHSLHEPFLRQLQSHCTGGAYGSAEAAASRYELMGYITFANHIQRLTASSRSEASLVKKLVDEYSDRVVIIDEVQNLRREQNARKGVSRAITEVLTRVDGIRLVLLSATPLYNDVGELNFLMQLVFRNDKDFVRADRVATARFDAVPLDEEDAALLVHFASRYVSYVRGGDPRTFPLRMWSTDAVLPRGVLHTPMVLSRMSRAQDALYERWEGDVEARNGGGAGGEDFSDELLAEGDQEAGVPAAQMLGSLRAQALAQICDVAFPVGESPSGPDAPAEAVAFGREGFSGAFKREDRKGAGGGMSYRRGVPAFLSAQLLADYSPKLAAVLRYVATARGVVLVYSRYIKAALDPLALALEHAGYDNLEAAMFLTPPHDRPRRARLGRYALIKGGSEETGGSSQSVNTSLLRRINSPENSEGGLVKVVLISDVASEGVDFKCIREVHVLEPWHNLSRTEQVIGRAVRTCSHALLPPEQRNATVYLHAMLRADGRETVEVEMYRTAEEKQVHIASLERLIKRAAMDCALGHGFQGRGAARDQVPVRMVDAQGRSSEVVRGDLDGSRACDFSSCDYDCLAGSPELAAARKQRQRSGGSATGDDLYLHLQASSAALRDQVDALMVRLVELLAATPGVPRKYEWLADALLQRKEKKETKEKALAAAATVLNHALGRIAAASPSGIKASLRHGGGAGGVVRRVSDAYVFLAAADARKDGGGGTQVGRRHGAPVPSELSVMVPLRKSESRNSRGGGGGAPGTHQERREDVVRTVRERHLELLSSLGPGAGGSGDPPPHQSLRRAALEQVLDHLDKEELAAVCAALAATSPAPAPDVAAFREEMRSALVSVGTLSEDGSCYYDHFGGGGGAQSDVPPFFAAADGSPLAAYAASKRMAALRAKSWPPLRRRGGFLAAAKGGGAPTFKMVHSVAKGEEALKGVVCTAFSQLKNSQLLAMVRRSFPGVEMRPGTKSRSGLCAWLELSLRVEGSLVRTLRHHLAESARRASGGDEADSRARDRRRKHRKKGRR